MLFSDSFYSILSRSAIHSGKCWMDQESWRRLDWHENSKKVAKSVSSDNSSDLNETVRAAFDVERRTTTRGRQVDVSIHNRRRRQKMSWENFLKETKIPRNSCRQIFHGKLNSWSEIESLRIYKCAKTLKKIYEWKKNCCEWLQWWNSCRSSWRFVLP